MTDLFNNREIAIGIWIFIFAICASTRKDIRHSFLKLIAASVKIVIMVPALLMIIYNVLVVWSIEILGLWEISQLKDTIVWFIFTGFVTAFNLVNDKKESHPFKQVIKDNVKFIIVFEAEWLHWRK